MRLEETHTAGGADEKCGCLQTSMRVTKNYGKLFDFRALDGLRASESLERLIRSTRDLDGRRISLDYFEATPGNVGYVIRQLIEWAMMFPDSKWRVE